MQPNINKCRMIPALRRTNQSVIYQLSNIAAKYEHGHRGVCIDRFSLGYKTLIAVIVVLLRPTVTPWPTPLLVYATIQTWL